MEADAKDLPTEYGFIRLKAVESVDSPVLGGVHVVLGGKPTRYAQATKGTVIV